MIFEALSLLPSWGKWLAGLIVAAALFVMAWGIYNAGYGKAQAEGTAALEKLKREVADANAARWAEFAAANKAARERLQAEQARADKLETALINTKNTLASERRGFAKRITDATRDNDCVLTADAVRLYNEALYGPEGAAGAGRSNESGGSADPSQHTEAPAPLGAGVLPEQPVTVRDLLAHAVLYGAWAQEVHAIALGWVQLSKDW